MGPCGSLSGRAWSRAARDAWRLECRTSATRADATFGAGHSFGIGGLVDPSGGNFNAETRRSRSQETEGSVYPQMNADGRRCGKRERDAELALGGPRGMGMGVTDGGAGPTQYEPIGGGAGPTLPREVVAGERGSTCCSSGGRRFLDRMYRINTMGPCGSLSGRAWSRAARDAWRLECRTSATRADATFGAGHSFGIGGLVDPSGGNFNAETRRSRSQETEGSVYPQMNADGRRCGKRERDAELALGGPRGMGMTGGGAGPTQDGPLGEGGLGSLYCADSW